MKVPVRHRNCPGRGPDLLEHASFGTRITSFPASFRVILRDGTCHRDRRAHAGYSCCIPPMTTTVHNAVSCHTMSAPKVRGSYAPHGPVKSPGRCLTYATIPAASRFRTLSPGQRGGGWFCVPAVFGWLRGSTWRLLYNSFLGSIL